MVCTGTSGGTTGGGDADTGDLEGEEGSFKNFIILGDPSSETVYEGDEQAVLGWEYEAQDSDLRTERVRVRFDGTVTGVDKPWKIIKEVCLNHGDDEVQCEVRNDLTEEFAVLAEQCIADAGKFFNIKCPHEGESNIGRNWHETH